LLIDVYERVLARDRCGSAAARRSAAEAPDWPVWRDRERQQTTETPTAGMAELAVGVELVTTENLSARQRFVGTGRRQHQRTDHYG
jgi:hypothetical protein